MDDMVKRLVELLCSDIDTERMTNLIYKVDEIFINYKQQEVILSCCFYLSQAYETFPDSAKELLLEAIKEIIVRDYPSIGERADAIHRC